MYKRQGIPTGAKESYNFDQISTIAHYIGPNPADVVPNIDIFPNPADDNVNIISNVEMIGLKIIDLNGKTVQEVKVNNDIFITDISSLLSGFYMVNIQTEKGIISKRLIRK